MPTQPPSIALLGSLDTKCDEFLFIKNILEQRGHKTLTIDTSIVGEPGYPPDISASDVVASAGEDLELLRLAGDRERAVSAVSVGVVRVVESLYEQGRLSGILSMGGRSGTIVGTAAMRNLPVGLPKVMVSTLASGDVSSFVGSKDVTLIHPIVDLDGLNRVTRQILASAAGAIAGMVEVKANLVSDARHCAALSTMGLTAEGCDQIRAILQGRGMEVIDFLADGYGGDAMEELIRDGVFDLVVDISTGELTDVLCGGGFASAGDRLTAAGRAGIPQVIGPGGLEFMRFGPNNRFPSRFSHRNIHVLEKSVTLVRINEEEAEIIAGAIARRLNSSRGPVKLVWPLKGFSALDAEDMPFFDLDIDNLMLDIIRDRLIDSADRLIEVDANINDYEYAVAVSNAVEVVLSQYNP